MENHFEKALEYVRKNHSWTQTDEAKALEDMVRYRSPIEFTDDDISDEIIELMERYGLENDLPEGWWIDMEEVCDVNDVFWRI